MTSKICLSLFIGLLSLFIGFSDVSALSVSNTYGNVTSSTSIANELVNYAISYDSFLESEYIIFQDDQYSYYIVWGDLTYGNGKVSAKEIEYIKYSRDSNTGYNYNISYDYGTDTSLSLSFSHSIVTSIPNLGFSNETYRIYKFNKYVINFLILLTGFIFVIMVKNLRRSSV